jgi:hypothetical protein
MAMNWSLTAIVRLLPQYIKEKKLSLLTTDRTTQQSLEPTQ